MTADAGERGTPGVIDVRIASASQLLNTLDPSPFLETSLGADAEAYLTKLARELPSIHQLRVIVHLAGASPSDEVAINAAIHETFALRVRQQESERRELTSVGRRALVIGVLIWAVCFLIALWLAARHTERTLLTLVQESIVIVGWVALWRPADLLLYDWIPYARRTKLYQRLALAEVRVESGRDPTDASEKRGNDA